MSDLELVHRWEISPEVRAPSYTPYTVTFLPEAYIEAVEASAKDFKEITHEE